MISSDAVMALAIFPAIAAVAWAGAFAWVQWLRHRHDLPSSSAARPAEPERLARLEAEVEALTLELERLGEGQRYTVRLLEQRLPQL